MDGCCDRDNYRTVFSDRFARRVARRYCKRGLSPAARHIAEFICEHGVEGASVLEIGGGVGELQIELLRRGASHVTNLEISDSYEKEAAALLERSGMIGRVDRRFLDIALAPDEVEPADIVVLHRVVCCYPDYERLLTAAADHAKRMLVYSHPPDGIVTKAAFGGENLFRRLRGQSFRAFVHPPDAMITGVEERGFTVRYQRRDRGWNVVGLLS